MTPDQDVELLTLLKSIAVSLEKLANPLVEVKPGAPADAGSARPGRQAVGRR